MSLSTSNYCYNWQLFHGDVMPLYIDVQDDMHIRVYNYNTLERVHQFEAHSDYIRSIAVHPTQTFILTSSGTLD